MFTSLSLVNIRQLFALLHINSGLVYFGAILLKEMVPLIYVKPADEKHGQPCQLAFREQRADLEKHTVITLLRFLTYHNQYFKSC